MFALPRNSGLRKFARGCLGPRMIRSRSHRLLHTVPPAPPPPPVASHVTALASLTSELDRLAPRFDISAGDIQIIKTPSDFYSILKVHWTCWYRSTMARIESLRAIAETIYRRRSWTPKTVYSCQPSTLDHLNMNLFVFSHIQVHHSSTNWTIHRLKLCARRLKTNQISRSQCFQMHCEGLVSHQRHRVLHCSPHL